MGMTATIAQISPEQLQDPSSIDLMEFAMGGGESVDLDKAWHGVHYLLTGEPWGGTGPVASAVLGGTEFGEDMGYGPPRYLTVGEVRSVASALESITSETLAQRFDPAAMSGAGIYCFDDGASDEDFENLCDYFEELRDFYLDAAKKENAVVQFLV